jgi:hypothetical protein
VVNAVTTGTDGNLPVMASTPAKQTERPVSRRISGTGHNFGTTTTIITERNLVAID